MAKAESVSGSERPYAFKWESAHGNEELLITDGSLKFWMDYGQIVSVVTWAPRSFETGTCRSRGVGEKTRVVCSHDGEPYGPHPDTSFDIQCCPYCGGDATDGDHRIDPNVGEVFCEQTGQSTWQFCPNCGDELGGEDS